MLTFIVPPFFCPRAEGLLLDAVPANAAATSIAAPSAAMAPESQTFFCIELLSMTQETGPSAGSSGRRILRPVRRAAGSLVRWWPKCEGVVDANPATLEEHARKRSLEGLARRRRAWDRDRPGRLLGSRPTPPRRQF